MSDLREISNGISGIFNIHIALRKFVFSLGIPTYRLHVTSNVVSGTIAATVVSLAARITILARARLASRCARAAVRPGEAVPGAASPRQPPRRYDYTRLEGHDEGAPATPAAGRRRRAAHARGGRAGRTLYRMLDLSPTLLQ